MSIFHPGARVRLVIRTEEFADTSELESRLNQALRQTPYGSPKLTFPQQTGARGADVTKQLAKNELQLRQLAHRKSFTPAREYDAERQRLLAEREAIRARRQSETTLIPPSAFQAGADDLTVIGSIVPMDGEINRSGLKTPNTFRITLNYSDAPFDPRVIRACGVEFSVGAVSPEDAHAGLGMGVTRSDGSLVSMIGDNGDGSKWGTRIVGFVDEWTVKYSEEGDTVTLQGRDMSAPLRDLKLNTGESIDLTLPIDAGVQELIDSVSPMTAGAKVRWKGDGEPPIPAGASAGRRRPRRGKATNKPKRGDVDMTIWDHITDVCIACGVVPTVHDFEIWLIEPRTLYAATDTLRMVYGKNLESLEFSRRIGGVKVPTIEVRCYDQSIGRVRWARWPVRAGEMRDGIMGKTNPPPALRASEVPPSGRQPTEAIRTIVVSNVHDPVMLRRIARNAFEQIGRQEIEGSFSTYEISSFGKDPLEMDLLDARTGSPIELLLAPARDDDPTPSTVADLQSMTRDRRKAYLQRLGWNEQVAARFAALQDARSVQSIFRLQDIKISWDNVEGVKINCNVSNYITVREDQVVAEDPAALRILSIGSSTAKTAETKSTPLFTVEGPSVYNAAYAHNSPFAKPSATLWNTVLSTTDEAEFRSWVAQHRIPFDVSAPYTDYDMRAYWFETIKPGGAFEGGHFPDTYKTPFDSTFSSESRYAVEGCPFNWQGDKLVDDRDGQVVFYSKDGR